MIFKVNKYINYTNIINNGKYYIIIEDNNVFFRN